MDVVCGADNWDVWLYEKDNNLLAAMPYYLEKRGKYNYITKAPLTQTNGINFGDENLKRSRPTRYAFEERVVNAAVEYINSLDVDVYEQQYSHTFDNWLPFFWHRYTAIPRYTYIIDSDELNEDEIWNNVSSIYRNKIRKGKKNSHITENKDPESFYTEHEKIFARQGLPCPFSHELWMRLYNACLEHDCCKMLYMTNDSNEVMSIIFLVWDEKCVYQLLGGNLPGYSQYASYDALIYEAICMAHEMGKKYDFEGSVIKRISKSMREFGGTPMPYFRIRKIFNEEILQKEYEEQRDKLREENDVPKN